MADIPVELSSLLSDRYELKRELGRGGMAVVYLAFDRKQRRLVALKVLRPELAASLGTDRFLREIEITANLVHPHILPLLESDERQGFLYYVMPYVEGETLRDRLEREEQLPIDDAIRIATQVADALSHAHALQLIHRDVKPENIFLSGGEAVIADFGIARAITEAGGERLTETGLAMGTPAYMSPEQAMGKRQVDGRTDIYALGCVLYEMLSGEPPFIGSTAQHILARKMTDTIPSLRAVRETVPEEFENVVMKALARSAADRFANVDELIAALQDPTLVTSVRPRSARRRVWIGATVVAVIAIVAAVMFTANRMEMPIITQTQRVTRATGAEFDPAISPNGTMVAYAAGPPGRMQIFVRPIDGGQEVLVTDGLAGHHRRPQWLPDESKLTFETLDSTGVVTLHMVAALGGVPVSLVRGVDATCWTNNANLWVPRSITFSPDAESFAFVTGDCDDVGERIVIRSMLGEEDRAFALPGVKVHSLTWSPDGRFVVYLWGGAPALGRTRLLSDGPNSVWILDLERDTSVNVMDHEQHESPQWGADGRTLFFVSPRDGRRDIYRVQIDRNGYPRGAWQRLTTDVDAVSISVSRDSRRLVYSTLEQRANVWSVQIDPGSPVTMANAQRVTDENQVVESIAVSPDGEWLAFDSDRSGNRDIWKMPIDGGPLHQLTTDPGYDFHPTWSPDGTEIAFYSMRLGSRDIYVMTDEGTGQTRLTDAPREEIYPWWRNRNTITYSVPNSLGIWSLQRSEAGWSRPERLLPIGAVPRWSPDGESFAFWATTSAEELQFNERENPDSLGNDLMLGEGANLYLSTDGATTARLIAMGSRFSRWSRSGQQLYFSTGEGIWSVAVAGGSPLLLLSFDERHVASDFDIYRNRVYLVIDEPEGDISSIDLEYR